MLRDLANAKKNENCSERNSSICTRYSHQYIRTPICMEPIARETHHDS